jgi:hypothetical protein
MTTKTSESSKAIDALSAKVETMSKQLKEALSAIEMLKTANVTLTALIAQATVRQQMIAAADTTSSTINNKIEPAKQKRVAFQAKNTLALFAKQNKHGVRERYFGDINVKQHFEKFKDNIKDLNSKNFDDLNEDSRGLVYKHISDTFYSEKSSTEKTAISTWLQGVIKASTATTAKKEEVSEPESEQDSDS